MVKVRQGKQTDYLAKKTSRKDVARREIHVIIGVFPKLQNSNLQAYASSETRVHTNTQRNLLMK